MMITAPKLTKDGKYLINGKIYPRLSVIMEMQGNKRLDAWKKRVGEEVARAKAEETSEWGTKVHLVTAYSDLKKYKKMEAIIKEDETLLPSLLSWQDYVMNYIKRIIAVEIIVWSDELKVAGTIDRIAIIKGDSFPAVLDLKTGSLYDEIGIKLAGYMLMWNERNINSPKMKVCRRIAVQIPRLFPGERKVKEYTKEDYVRKFTEAVEQYYTLTR